jgi:hypothetical protein
MFTGADVKTTQIYTWPVHTHVFLADRYHVFPSYEFCIRKECPSGSRFGQHRDEFLPPTEKQCISKGPGHRLRTGCIKARAIRRPVGIGDRSSDEINQTEGLTGVWGGVTEYTLDLN